MPTLEEHVAIEGMRIDSICGVIDEMQCDIKEIKDNHLAHLSEAQITMKVDMAEVKANTQWLMKTYWIVVTAAVGSCVAAFASLIFRR